MATPPVAPRHPLCRDRRQWPPRRAHRPVARRDAPVEDHSDPEDSPNQAKRRESRSRRSRQDVAQPHRRAVATQCFLIQKDCRPLVAGIITPRYRIDGPRRRFQPLRHRHIREFGKLMRADRIRDGEPDLAHRLQRLGSITSALPVRYRQLIDGLLDPEGVHGYAALGKLGLQHRAKLPPIVPISRSLECLHGRFAGTDLMPGVRRGPSLGMRIAARGRRAWQQRWIAAAVDPASQLVDEAPLAPLCLGHALAWML